MKLHTMVLLGYVATLSTGFTRAHIDAYRARSDATMELFVHPEIERFYAGIERLSDGMNRLHGAVGERDAEELLAASSFLTRRIYNIERDFRSPELLNSVSRYEEHQRKEKKSHDWTDNGILLGTCFFLPYLINEWRKSRRRVMALKENLEVNSKLP